MMYLLALILPPVALFAIGKVIQGIINLAIGLIAAALLIFTLGIGSGISFILWLIIIAHALFAVHSSKADARTQKIIDAAGNNQQD